MADELIFYPESEKAPHRDKPKGPYVKFLKKKRHHLGTQRQADEPEFREVEHTCYFPVSVAPNIEAIDNFRHTGARVIGFGNFPRKKPYGEIRAHLLNNTELMFSNPDNDMRKFLEAQIREEIAREAEQQEVAIAEGRAVENPATKAKKGKEIHVSSVA